MIWLLAKVKRGGSSSSHWSVQPSCSSPLPQVTYEKRSDKVDGYIDNFNVILSDIRSDVSFIRGKMEGGK
ncbi:MAG: hypothetical protein J5615_01555 [Fibrobacter sp.]|nr:hypothetical protein [Fibrobacter sp.]